MAMDRDHNLRDSTLLRFCRIEQKSTSTCNFLYPTSIMHRDNIANPNFLSPDDFILYKDDSVKKVSPALVPQQIQSQYFFSAIYSLCLSVAYPLTPSQGLLAADFAIEMFEKWAEGIAAVELFPIQTLHDTRDTSHSAINQRRCNLSLHTHLSHALDAICDIWADHADDFDWQNNPSHPSSQVIYRLLTFYMRLTLLGMFSPDVYMEYSIDSRHPIEQNSALKRRRVEKNGQLGERSSYVECFYGDKNSKHYKTKKVKLLIARSLTSSNKFEESDCEEEKEYNRSKVTFQATSPSGSFSTSPSLPYHSPCSPLSPAFTPPLHAPLKALDAKKYSIYQAQASQSTKSNLSETISTIPKSKSIDVKQGNKLLIRSYHQFKHGLKNERRFSSFFFFFLKRKYKINILF